MSNLSKYIVIAVLLGGVAILFSKVVGGGGTGDALTVKVPALSATAVEGEKLFNENCAACHGKNAAGTTQGPSFIDPIYRPNHHGDEAFGRAARDGVRAHHWRFGNMPPRPEVSEQQIAKIVRYIRELQQANGIN
ncbi:Cytochrome c family protein [hydrothermal vent metagenome]|uniref:Cytochrome c family protein n=1 Tax=hydrothermal vent metagenome TaxID=652676 RepID=A0A3B0TDN2_9ZZZZ